MTTNPIPQGHTTVTPYLIVRDAKKAIEFYRQAFGAKEIRRMEADGKIMHAEIRIGSGHIMLADEFPEQGFHSPESLGGSPAFVHLYVENVDVAFGQAISSGAVALQDVEDQVFGDRHGLVRDPFGYTWTIATHIEDVSDEEIQRRMAQYSQEMSGS